MLTAQAIGRSAKSHSSAKSAAFRVAVSTVGDLNASSIGGVWHSKPNQGLFSFNFTKFIFPVLRRVFPALIANDIVSVQPMTAPVDGLFSMITRLVKSDN